VKVCAHRMIREGLAWRPVEGRVAFTHDSFAVAAQLVEPSYISLTTALYLRGFLDQVPQVTECVTTRDTRRVRSTVYRSINRSSPLATQERRGVAAMFSSHSPRRLCSTPPTTGRSTQHVKTAPQPLPMIHHTPSNLLEILAYITTFLERACG